MSGRLTKGAFMALIEGDIAWLMQQPDTLERAHIKACLDWATKLHYPEHDAHAAGYAEAVADIRQMLKGKLPEQETLIGGMVLILVDEWIATCAHVGAAKKEGV